MASVTNEGYPHHWRNCTVSYRETQTATMMDFHQHVYYEVSLILTGKVKTLLRDRSDEGTQSRLVLTAPGTPHWMQLTEPSHYSRINLCFSEEFVAEYWPEWRILSEVFGEGGNILHLTEEEKESYRAELLQIGEEKNSFRQRLMIYLFLSRVRDAVGRENPPRHEMPPAFVVEALTYIGTHYHERIIASELAWHLGVGRTTLMTAFKRHTGSTLGEYITRTRVRRAVSMMERGESQEAVAVQVGFCNGSSMIRAFRHCYGMTPGQYIKQKQREDGGGLPSVADKSTAV